MGTEQESGGFVHSSGQSQQVVGDDAAADAGAAQTAIQEKIEQAAAETQAAKVRLEAGRMAQMEAQRRLTALEELQAEMEAGSEARLKAGEAQRARRLLERRVFQRVLQIMGVRFVWGAVLLACVLFFSGVFLGAFFAWQRGGLSSSVPAALPGLEAAPPIYSGEGESERLAGEGVRLRLDENGLVAFPASAPAGAGSE